MNLRKRLRVYLIGVGIGVLLSFIIFDGRGCEWLPSNRVLDAIQRSKIMIAEKDKCLIGCEGISSEKIYKLIEEGSVYFGESDVRNRDYRMEYDGLVLNIKISPLDTTSYIHGIHSSSDCAERCGGKDSIRYTVLYKPNDLVLKKLKSLNISVKKKAKCELECFGLKENDLEQVLESGIIMFNQSFPNRKPNPLFYIKQEIRGNEYLFWVEQGATKVRFLHVVNYSENLLREGEPLSLMFKKSYRLKDCNCDIVK